MYLRVFNSAEGITFHPIERFATPDRVFDDMWATFRISGDGFRELPVPHRHQGEDAIVAQLPYPRWNDRQGNRLRDMATRRVEDENRPCVTHVRFGSQADICSAKRHVCFTPLADIRRCRRRMSGPSANAGRWRCRIQIYSDQ